MNLSREVKTERFSQTEGKTPAFVDYPGERCLRFKYSGPPDISLASILDHPNIMHLARFLGASKPSTPIQRSTPWPFLNRA